MTLEEIQKAIIRIKEWNKGFSIREAVRSDADDFVTLFNSHYKRKITANYFYWQFFDDRSLTKLFICTYGGRLIGHYGIKKMKIKDIDIGFTIDLFIHEDFRGKGLFFLLEEQIRLFAKTQRLKLIFSLPNSYGSSAMQKLGWKKIYSIHTMEWTKEEKEVLQDPINPIRDLWKIKKNMQHYLYRFRDNPTYKYKKIFNGNDFAFVKTYKDVVNSGNLYGDIVDFSSDVNDIEQMIQLFEKVKKYFIKQNIASITAWGLPHTRVYNALQQVGFDISPQERNMLLYIIDSKYNFLYDINNWDLREADSEVF